MMRFWVERVLKARVFCLSPVRQALPRQPHPPLTLALPLQKARPLPQGRKEGEVLVVVRVLLLALGVVRVR